MFIKLDGKVVNPCKYISFERNNINYYVSGIFFIPGFKAGRESLVEFVKRYEAERSIDFINCMGSFSFIIEKEDETIAFTDNGIGRCFFYNKNVLADNILELIKNERGIELDKRNIVQYIVYNKIFFDQTYVKGVLSSNNNEFYIIRDNKIYSFKKNIGTLESEQYALPAEAFSEILKESLSEINKVVSLTGGFDSRYILSLLLGSNNLAASISGTDKTHSDFVISKKVAETAGVRYKQEIIPKPNIDDNYMIKMFLQRGGYFNTFNDGNFRLNEYLRRKKEENCQCLITGDTGCFHKSEGWYAYFPFYRSKHYSIKRYKQLFLDTKRKLPLSPYSQEMVVDIEKEILKYLKINKKTVNTNNYDWQSWYLNKVSGYKFLYNSQNMLLTSYPPLLEYRFVINSYNLPRKERAMAFYMKKYMTSIDHNIAKIPTASKSTASSEKRFILRDSWFQICQLFQAALRLFGRIILKKNFFVENVIDWTCQDEVRNLKLSEEALDFAYKENIFEKQWTTQDVPYDILCKLIEIYLLKEYSKGRF